MSSLPVEHVKITAANLKQLTDFATIMMGLDIPKGARKDDIIAIIEQSGWAKDTIPTFQKANDLPEICDSEGSPRPRTFQHDFNDKGKMRECVAISIPETDKPGGQEPVPVAVNGSQMWIPRNQRVVIPVEYVEVLENAEQFVYEETKDGMNEQGLAEPRVVKSYPFSYVA